MGLESSRLYAKNVVNDVGTTLSRHRVIKANLFSVQSHLQHYSEPTTADTLPASSSALNNTVLPLGPGTLTHNTAGIPIIVVCSKADLIDEENDMVAGATGMGGMVKGKGGEWEERTDGVMQVLRTICLKCESPRALLVLLINLSLASRWCILILHNFSTCYSPGSSATRSSFALRAPSTFPLFSWRNGCSHSSAKPISLPT
jgi:hypothetical protein